MDEDVLEVELDFVRYFKYSFTFLVRHVRNPPEGKVVFETVRLSLRYAASTALLLAIMGTTFVMVVAHDEESVGMPAFIKVIKIVVTLRCLSLSVRERKNLAKFLNWILDSDRELYSQGCEISYRLIKTVLLCKFAIVCTVLCSSIVICASLTRDVVGICALHVGVYNIPYLISSSILLQFTFFTVSLWERIRSINCSVTNLVLKGGLNREPFCIPHEDPERSSHHLRALANFHSEICKGAKLINSTYSEQLLLTIVQTTIEILNSVYSFLKGGNKMAIYYDGFWALMAVLELLAFILPCSSVMRQSRRTAQIMNMLDVAGDEKLKFERALFLLQMAHQKVEFSASGFFALDETILLNIVSTAVSYIIIQMQFEYAR